MYLSTRNLSHSVAVAPDRRHAQYAGAAAHKLDVGVVRAGYSWPTTKKSFQEDVRNVPIGIDYFEVKIEEAGQNWYVSSKMSKVMFYEWDTRLCQLQLHYGRIGEGEFSHVHPTWAI